MRKIIRYVMRHVQSINPLISKRLVGRELSDFLVTPPSSRWLYVEVFLLVIEARKRNEHIFQEKKLAKTTKKKRILKIKNIF
jgi:hypothetical protein